MRSGVGTSLVGQEHYVMKSNLELVFPVKEMKSILADTCLHCLCYLVKCCIFCLLHGVILFILLHMMKLSVIFTMHLLVLRTFCKCMF